MNTRSPKNSSPPRKLPRFFYKRDTVDRQAALIGPLGGHFCRNTLAANVVRAGMAVQPVIDLMRDHLVDADLILGDETELQVLKEPGRSARTKSYLWAQMSGTGPPIRPGDKSKSGVRLI